MQIIGKIKVINAEQQVSATYRKRELVVTTDEQYPQHINIEFAQDKCDLLKNLKIGQGVTVSINLRGREWVSPQGETKYFNSIHGWRVEVDAIESKSDALSTPAPAFEPASDFKEEDHDDLPF